MREMMYIVDIHWCVPLVAVVLSRMSARCGNACLSTVVVLYVLFTIYIVWYMCGIAAFPYTAETRVRGFVDQFDDLLEY